MSDTLFLNNGHRADIHFERLLLLKQRTHDFVFSFAYLICRKAIRKSSIGYCLPARWIDFLSTFEVVDD